MIIRRGFKFKLKTTPEQASLLHSWVGHARFAWNKALGINLGRLQQQQPILWYEELDFWSKRWKKSNEYGFLSELPAHCLQQKLMDLQRAFLDAFDTAQPNKRLPTFKKRGKADSIRFPESKHILLDGNRIKLPKIGWLRFFHSRQIEGRVCNATIRREGDDWYVSIQTEMEIEPIPSATSLVALDRGIRDFVAFSDGKRIPSLNAFQRYQDQLAYWQRKLAKKVKFSENWKKLKRKIGRLHRKITRCRHDYLHKLSTAISKRHAMVVLEQLQVKNMSSSARGTIEEPGSNVAQKRGLNRRILDQGWSLFADMLEYKLAARGGSVLYVPAAYTSQTCPVCLHRERDNRRDKRFRCAKCDYEHDADIVGAMNIEAAGQTLLASPT